MSRDQKPGKVRVVGGGAVGGSVPLRRRSDDAPAADELVSAMPVAEEGGEEPRKANRLLPMLFVSGCAIGGAALPLMRAL